MNHQQPLQTPSQQTSPGQETALGERTIHRLKTLPNPYVGPRPFTAAERDRFFGREQEANQIIPLIIAERLVLFYAQSGAGKSSLINARLVPGLIDRNFKVLTGRVSGQLAEGAQADNIFIYNLLLSFERSEHNEGNGADDALSLAHVTLSDYLANMDIEMPASSGDGSEAPKLLLDAPQTIAGVQPLALIIDQFEEIFTTNQGAWNQRAAFFEQVSEAMQADPYLWVVFSIREDYLASLDPYAELLPGKMRARFYMQRMEYNAAMDAVRKPVENLRPFEDAAAEELVRNLSLINVGKDKNNQPIYKPGQFIEPVQLQVVCFQLWEELRNQIGKNITTNDLFSLAKGKDLAQFISTALGNYYEQSLREVMKLYPDIRERRLRDWFSHELITDTETRSSVRQGKQNTGAPPNDLPNQVVKTLQDRFIIRAEIRGENTWYELSHDRFVGAILQSNREWYNKNARPVEVAAQVWSDTGQETTRLYDGRQLQDALRQLQESPDDISEKARKFIEASQAFAEKRQKRRQQVITALSGLLLIVLSALTAYSLYQTRIASAKEMEANMQRAVANYSSTQANQQRSTAVAASLLEAEQRHRAETASAMEAGLRQAAESARVTAEAAKDQAEVSSTLAVEERDAARKAENTAQKALNQAQGARLSSLSDYFRNNKLDLSLLLALQAIKVSGDWQSQRVLLSGIQRGLENRVSPVGFPWRVDSQPYHVAFSPDGALLAAGSIGNVDVWNVDGQGRVANQPPGFESDATMYGVSFNTTGQLLARAGQDGEVRIWDRFTNKVTVFRPFKYVYSSILTVAFQPGGDILAVGTDKDPSTGKGLLFFYNFKTSQVEWSGDCDRYACGAMAWSPDGKKLAVGSQGGTILVLDAITHTPIMEVERAHAGKITGVAWYPDGQRLISGGVDQRLVQWDTAAHKIIRQTTNKNTPIVLCLALSPDGRFLVAGVNDRSTWFGLWDAETLQKMNYQLRGHSRPVASVAFNPQGNYFVTASYDNSIILWKLEPVESLSRLVQNVSAGRVESILLDSDGKLSFAGATGASDLETITEGAEKPHIQKVAHSAIEMASINGQPAVVVGGTDGKVSFLDPVSGGPLREAIRPAIGSVRSLATSADGKLLATAACTVGQSCGQIGLWDLSADKAIELSDDLKGITLGVVSALAFSPDSQTLVIGNGTGNIFFYNLVSGKVEQVVTEGLSLENMTMVVTSLAFSPEQNLLAAGFHDGRVALWEASSRGPIGEFVERANGEVTGLLFRKNAEDGLWYLLSVSNQGEVREWTVDQKAWFARACQLARRNLTDEEKAKFLLPGSPQAGECPVEK
jgi:WD40 repeat protein